MYCVVLDYFDNDSDGIFRTVSTDFDDYEEVEQFAIQYCNKPHLVKHLLKLLGDEDLIEKVKTCQVSIEADHDCYKQVWNRTITF